MTRRFRFSRVFLSPAFVLVLLGAAGCRTFFSPEPPAPPATWQLLANLEYQTGALASGRVQLRNGTQQTRPFPRSAAVLTFTLLPAMTVGDLDGDGRDDAAAILVSDPGNGAATFCNLAAVVQERGRYRNVATKFLGSGVRVRGLFIQDGRIVVDMLPPAGTPGSAMPFRRVFRLEDERLEPATLPEPSSK